MNSLISQDLLISGSYCTISESCNINFNCPAITIFSARNFMFSSCFYHFTIYELMGIFHTLFALAPDKENN